MNARARYSFRQTWIDPLATLAVVVAALVVILLVLPAR